MSTYRMVSIKLVMTINDRQVASDFQAPFPTQPTEVYAIQAATGITHYLLEKLIPHLHKEIASQLIDPPETPND